MAKAVRSTRVIGNPARLFGLGKGKKKTARRNVGEIVGFTLANPATKKKGVHMAKTSTKKNKAGSKGLYKHNAGSAMKVHHHHKPKRRNVGEGVPDLVNTGLFTIAGALGSKLGAQMVLGTNNTGVIGYLTNAAIGGVMWFGASKFLKSRAASNGIAIGTVVQILLRVINDYTPFGQYLSSLGMGDYQVQAFVTPQVLVDPLGSATLANGYTPPAPPIAAPVATAADGTGKGMAGLYDANQGGFRGLYSV